MNRLDLTWLDWALLAGALFILLHLFPAGFQMHEDAAQWRATVNTMEARP